MSSDPNNGQFDHLQGQLYKSFFDLLLECEEKRFNELVEQNKRNQAEMFRVERSHGVEVQIPENAIIVRDKS